MSITMTPGLRKFALTAHVTSSVGLLGSIAAFLALALAGLINQDAQIVRAAYQTPSSISSRSTFSPAQQTLTLTHS